MKKITVAIATLVFGIFFSTSSATAGGVFNTAGGLPTITVTENACQQGPINGCWQTSATVSPGQSFGAQIFYHNSGDDVAIETTLSLKPRTTGTVSSVTLTGGVASLSTPRAVGSATVFISGNATVTMESACWYPNANSGCQSVNISALTGTSGFNIGSIYPGQQGVLVATYRVGSSSGGGGGDTSDCRIDSFDADDYSIDEGDSVELTWRTTGCDQVKISPSVGTVSLDGQEDVDPNSTTTYTLTAYENGNVEDTDTVRIVVDEDDDNDSCSIDSFRADDDDLEEGDSTTIRWTTTGAEDVDLSPGYTNRSDDGSVRVSPSRTTSYTLEVQCDNGDDKSRRITISVDEESDERPQAVTTVATVTSASSAQLNGIAIPNSNSGTTRAWFEWGPSTSVSFKTSSQNVSTGTSSTNYTDQVSGLVPGTSYYYRAVVQNQNGTAYGDTVRFQTRSTTPTTVVRTQTVTNTVVAKSAASLLELSVMSKYDNMCVGGDIEYTITYRNLSTQNLRDAVLQINHQKEVTFIGASRGDYDVVDRTITVDLGDLSAGETGTVLIRGKVNGEATRGNLTVMTAQAVYTNPATRAQEDALAYSLVTVSDDCPNLFGSDTSLFGSFLPDTLLEWLLLILVILALIVLGRQFYRKREEYRPIA